MRYFEPVCARFSGSESAGDWIDALASFLVGCFAENFDFPDFARAFGIRLPLFPYQQ